mmetsp:Transcript_6836/g.19324  ORF Transcript_6836/g.19324 Transcript_6836/m.19324 type:complete len:1393 (+) Transcript_6836:72-4250(+)
MISFQWAIYTASSIIGRPLLGGSIATVILFALAAVIQVCIQPVCSASLENETCSSWTEDTKQSMEGEPAAEGDASSHSYATWQLLTFWLVAVGMYLLMVFCILSPLRKLLPLPIVKELNCGEPSEPETPPTPSDEESPANTAAKAANAAAVAASAAEAATKLNRDTQASNSATGSVAGVAAVAADAAASAALAAAAAAAAAADSAFIGSRFLLRFQDDNLEASWEEWVLGTGHHKKKTLYFGTFVGLSILHIVEFVESIINPCFDSMGKAALRVFVKIALLLGVARLVAVCWVQTDHRLQLHPSSNVDDASGARQQHTLECLVILFCFFYVPAQSFPPFAPWPCKDLVMYEADYSLQGHTALQLQILLILLASWLAPTFEMLYSIWCWIAGVYFGWSLVWRCTLVLHPYSLFDISCRALLLGAVSVIAITRRFHRERGERLRFLQDLQQKESSKQIFRYLEYMMPAHVIGPMLKSPDLPIAEQVNRVSILFIMIADFDRLTEGMAPRRLLHFLNEQFVRIDQICAANGVAKIETVREEYVACVGVLPSDREDSESSGHSAVLGRLVRAAGQILELQTRAVQYKMGIHTGPIVAGVIGRKLPRYRLFGDTMNFAARHMQKGVLGKLQFGVETRKDLPPALLPRVVCRGEVEMKGKGKVMAYLFEPEQRLSRTTLPELPTFMPRVSLAESKAGDFNTRFESALLVVTATEEAQAKRWVLSEKEGFTLQMETSWLLWHNQHFICKNLGRWVGGWVIFALLLSGYGHSFAAYHASRWNHQYYDASWRLSVFVYCRGMAVILMLALWYACDEHKSMVLDNPCMAQALIVLVGCFVALLLFCSSDALVISNGPEYLAALSSIDLGDHAPQDHIFKLIFMLLFDSVTKALTPRFFHSVVFVVLAVLIVVIQLLPPSNCELPRSSSWFSAQGHLLFVAAAVLNAVGSHQDEQDSRARYKSKCAVELTSARTEKLLDRLMPPLIVASLRSMAPGAAPPSHEFRHATIAQSDLCGFTQLASQRSPLEVVKFMGDLFGAFDDLTNLHQVYKVDTVGDAYIAGMAEEPLTTKNSPISVVNFALDVVTAVQAWARDLGVSVNCRVGVHYGQCIGGIVGKSMQFKLGAESGYQLFGALLTGLEILESTSPEGRVQISRACREELEREMQSDTAAKECETMTFEPRLEKQLTTSKGEMHDFSEVGGLSYLVQRRSPLSADAERPSSASQTSSSALHTDSSVAATSAASGDFAVPGSQRTWSLPDLSAFCGNTIREDEEDLEDLELSEQSEPDSMSEGSFASEADEPSEPGASWPNRCWTPVMSREVLEPVFEPSPPEDASGAASSAGSDASVDADMEAMLTQVMCTEASAEERLGLCLGSAAPAGGPRLKAEDFGSDEVLGDRRTIP